MFRKVIPILRGATWLFPKGISNSLRVYGNVKVRGRKSKIIIGRNVRIYDDVSIIVNGLNNMERVIIGDNCVIEKGSYLNAHNGYIKIGSNVHIGVNTIIQGKSGVVIDDNTMLAPFVQIYSSNHQLQTDGKPRSEYPEKGEKVHIGKNNWICANVIILSGYTSTEDRVLLPGEICRMQSK